MPSNAAPFVAVGLGEILWDLLPGGRKLGGAPANFAYHALQLGAAAHAVSAVGDDALGREILDRLDALGLGRETIAVDPAHPTGTVSVALDAKGVPRFTIHEGVAWDHIPWTPALEALARRADAVCFGSLAQRAPGSRETIRRFLAATRPDALRLFDVNLRQTFYTREILDRSLAAANVIKLNDDELPVVGNLLGLSGRAEEMLRAFLGRYGLRLAVLTRGERGSLMVAPEGTSDLAGERVTVVDTVGAGDAFTAATAMGLLRGLPLDRLHPAAGRLGAYVCTQAGATPLIPPELVDTLWR